MRAMNALRVAVLFSSGAEFVLLGVTEILDIQSTLLFAKRCLRKAAFIIGFEWAEVEFQASDQCYVLKAISWANGGEYVASYARPFIRINNRSPSTTL